jgi:hypothetical protein
MNIGRLQRARDLRLFIKIGIGESLCPTGLIPDILDRADA